MERKSFTYIEVRNVIATFVVYLLEAKILLSGTSQFTKAFRFHPQAHCKGRVRK